jgi:hypothetical protein
VARKVPQALPDLRQAIRQAGLRIGTPGDALAWVRARIG